MDSGEKQCDVLVLGAGAAGLTAAITTASAGLDVLVVEKATRIGGAAAWSGGWLWLPCNPLMDRGGQADDRAAARTYLENEIGPGFDAGKVNAFLDAAPSLVAFLEQQTDIRFLDGVTVPDYHASTPGASPGGRSLVVAPFDGRQLGGEIHRLRKPLKILTLAGLALSAGSDVRHFYNAARSAKSALHAVRRVAGYVLDRLRFGRGMYLVNGNALAAGLMKAALDFDVRIETSAPAVKLLQTGGRVIGAAVRSGDDVARVHARHGVVLACGGFPSDVERRKALFAHTSTGREHWTAAPQSCDGDGLRLGEAVGGRVSSRVSNAGAWAPVSLVPCADGGTHPFPHFAERAKPGVIAVTRDGMRFVNEAAPYFTFMEGLFAACPPGTEVAAWLICDHRFQRRYGLGASKPFPVPVRAHLKSGYIKRGNTLAALADACGIDADALAATVERYNRFARQGRDPDYGRGDEPVNRAQGDADHQPNPCVAPIERPPFYAVKVLPGSLGTFAGLCTDSNARVSDMDEQPIRGLYAVGADMASIMAGSYPAGGISLGPAMTFGFIAGRHLVAADNTSGEPQQPFPPARRTPNDSL